MAQNRTEWVTYIKNDYQPIITYLPLVEAINHPLKPTTVIITDRTSKRNVGSVPSTGYSTPSSILEPLGLALEGTDPLTQFAKEELDPLSQMALDAWDKPTHTNTTSKKTKERKLSIDMEPWSSRKAGILAKFTTSEKLSIVTSFLSGGEKVVVKAQSSAVDKVKHRLEQLDDFEEGSVRQMLDLSQQEYVNRIEQLNQELVQAWHSDQRVRALKIAIQCAKLLVDTSVIQFYPSKFVLITDILDIFGKLVYERLRTKAEYYKPGSKVATSLPEDFTPDMVPESAKETCRNWFYKIASIRELVPRLYVETAILKSYSFLTSSEYSAALLRLTRMVRGIGDPLVAAYARCYLCRVGITISTPTSNRDYLIENFYDYLSTYTQLFGGAVKMELAQQRIDLSTYLTLYTPALDFILQAVAAGASEMLLADILDRCKKQGNSALLLNAIMAAFKPSYIASRALQFIDLITQCNDEGFPQYLLFRTLGLCLTVIPPLSEHKRQVLNLVWKVVTNLSDPAQYISCAEVWVQYTVMHFSIREINTFLGDIIRHMVPERAYEKHYPQLKAVIEKVVNYTQDFEALLAMDNLLPLVDLFQQENVKVEVCKSIMMAYSAQPEHTTCDPVIINALIFVCRVLHDSVNAMTVEDETKQISQLISTFVRRVDYGKDFEQQLSFYVEARRAFTNLDLVHAQLVQSVNRLAVKTRQVVKGHHTRKTGSFVRACAAYCFITIPSINSVCTRLELYLLSGQVALLNNCLGQADACFKAALSLITDLPTMFEIDNKHRSSEIFLIPYIKNFLSTLLIVPDNPENGVLYLTRGLLNILKNYAWDQHSTARSVLYISVLDVLSMAGQDNYPYHVDKVDSNDALYGADPKFIAEINKMCNIIVDEVLADLKHLGQTDQLRKQSQLAMELFIRIVTRSDITNPAMVHLATNLWQLSQRSGQYDKKLADRSLEYLKQRKDRPELKQLAEALRVYT